MKIISVKNVSKEFKYYKAKKGFSGGLKNLFKRDYTTKLAVNDVSFDINKGELVGFIGPNGAGKTTTLKMLSGLLYPTRGDIKVLNYFPFDKKHDFLKQISILMGQKNQLAWELTAKDTFKLYQAIYEVPIVEYNKTIDELIDMLGCDEIIDKQVRSLSLGERMKCEIIASLLYKPNVLFLDEPTIGLDVVVSKKLRRFIAEYNKKHESTIILTSHYMNDVAELCERVIIINEGKIYFDGKLKGLIKNYANEKVITLNFEKEVTMSDLKEYGEVEFIDTLKASIKVDRNKVKHIAAAMLEKLPIEDVEINEVAVEDVIRNIFEKK